jgi:hypothetical protein
MLNPVDKDNSIIPHNPTADTTVEEIMFFIISEFFYLPELNDLLYFNNFNFSTAKILKNYINQTWLYKGHGI